MNSHIWQIRTWYGTYRFSTGGTRGGITPARNRSADPSLFFLLASLRRRDRETMRELALIEPGILTKQLPPFLQIDCISDGDIHQVAHEIQSRVESGGLDIEPIDAVKGLFVRDVPPPPPEAFNETPEEVVSSAPAEEQPAEKTTTTWYEVVVLDENDQPIKKAEVVFSIGQDTYTVPTDDQGRARIEEVEEKEATARITLPENPGQSSQEGEEGDQEQGSAADSGQDSLSGAESASTDGDTPVETIHCDFIEIPDILFHHASAVPCLDGKGVLLGGLAAAFRFAKDNPSKEVVIFGHADTSGEPAYNYDLSQWRSEGIKALLDNNADVWLDVVDLASKIEDYQTILKALAVTHGWNCDPGDVDNTDGPKTKAAVKTFQEQYNTKFRGDLKPDGAIGPKTWSAIFSVMRDLLIKAVSDGATANSLPQITYGINNKGVYPCGESFPIEAADKDNYTSAANRRVEIVFFDKGKTPELAVPADKKKVEKKEAPVYDAAKTVKKPIPAPPAAASAAETVTILLEFLFPAVNDAGKPHKQYVNLEPNDKENGQDLVLRVRPKDIKVNVDNERVYWRVTADGNNSKRTDPKTGIKKDKKSPLVDFSSNIANLDTPFANREASIILSCGVAGGDRFTVEVGCDGENFTQKVTVENWRKLWYETVQPAAGGADRVSDYTVFTADKTPGMSAKSIKYMKNVLNPCFIEFEQRQGTNYNKDDIPQKAKYNIIDGDFIGKEKGKNAVVLSLDQAKGILGKKGKYLMDARTASVIWCDYLVAFENRQDEFGELYSEQDRSTTFKYFPNLVDEFKGMTQGTYAITKLTWKATHWYDTTGGAPIWKKIISSKNPGWKCRNGGVFTKEDDIKAHVSFKNFSCFSFHFPETDKNYPGSLLQKDAYGQLSDNGFIIGLSVVINGIANRMGLNGAALKGTIWMNTFAGAASDIGIAGVILHELGHNMGQVYADKSVDATFGRPANQAIPGIPFPKEVPAGIAYGGREHQGTHCACGLKDTTKKEKSYQTAQAFKEKNCLMFGASDMESSREYSFCPDCCTYIKAENLSDIRRSWT
jgi:outer membrane protein OmpA-like peptidoglycan-associated protein